MLKKLVKKIISYKPEFYWRLQGRELLIDPWQRKIFPQHLWLVKNIKNLKPQSILEVGCGFGRNLKYLLDHQIPAEKLTGIDISPVLLAQAKLPKSVHLIKANVSALPFSKNNFDLVFTHGLLMHLSPRQLRPALTELVRVSKKYLILIEEVRPRPCQLNYFTWAHDYDKIIQTLPLKIKTKKKSKYSLICYLLEK